ncbi:hypothetical protein M407DRAFT_27396 [Tulasnella calospora MUT 4182]|uniref:Serine-threonine/tyrosine-protein kinase catalytic domain-containing protein n=1 Tax=Tulasnella calospora MUT 4182 TaxID=1051891 RepID=A0A0C3QCF9_9AGAM|nr:hypothetical protein M407DRAFT_27396 [Tulasnella calospora MUT 4182]
MNVPQNCPTPLPSRSEMRSAESDSAAPSHAPGSSHDASSGRVHLSAKLTDRLEKLAKWRISPSRFELPEGGPKFHGGYATVLRALLYYSRESEEGVDELDNARDEVEENSCDLKLNDGVPNSEDDSERQKEESSDEKATSKGEDAVEGLEQGSNDEASGRWKAVAVKKMKISGELTRVLGLTLREAEFLVDLEHESIIELVGFVEDVSKDIIWLVFPWEDNGNLKGFIASADWEIPERISLPEESNISTADNHLSVTAISSL